MSIVISLGGSFLFDKKKDTSLLFNELKKLNEKFLVITGGGSIAREYIDFSKEFNLSEKRTAHSWNKVHAHKCMGNVKGLQGRLHR